MAGSIFDDKFVKPTEKKLSEALGASFKYWEEIKSALEAEFGGLMEEWKYYGPKSGWILKLLHKKRNLFFLTPCKGYFRVAFVFGDKAVSAIERSDLPKDVIGEVRNAKKYAEGRGLRIEVKKSGDVENIKKLVAIKIRN